MDLSLWFFYNTTTKTATKTTTKTTTKSTTKTTTSNKKSGEIENIVNEWDTPTINILLEQTKIGNDMMKKIENIGKKKSFAFPPELFYSSDAKMLLEELIKKYSIQEIDDVMKGYIKYISDDAKLPQDKDAYPLYQKRLTKTTLNKILKSNSPLGKKQANELKLK